MQTRTRWLLTVLAGAFGLCLCYGAWAFLDSTPRASAGSPAGPDRAAVDAALVEHERLDGSAPIQVERSADEAGAPKAELPLPGPGTLQFTVLDSARAEPLSGLHLRFLSDRRFAELSDADSAVSVLLTSGRWEVSVARRGYETLIHRFEVREDQITDGGTLLLDRGDATIAGNASVRQTFESPWVFVELLGEGRNRCALCRERERQAQREKLRLQEVRRHFEEAAKRGEAPPVAGTDAEALMKALGTATLDNETAGRIADSSSISPEQAALLAELEEEKAKADQRPEELKKHCPRCGWGPESSRFGVVGHGPFSFPHLTGGEYLLRAWTHSHPRGVHEWVEVEAWGEAWAELFVPTPVRVDFALSDEDGQPFAGPLDEQGELLGKVFTYTFWQGEQRVVQARLRPKVQRSTNMTFRLGGISFSDQEISESSEAIDPRMDRARQDGDQLLAPSARPGLPSPRLQASFLAPHLHRIEGLPAIKVEVEVRCGNFCSSRVPVDLAQQANGTVGVRMYLAPEDQPPAEIEGAILELSGSVFTLNGLGEGTIQLEGLQEQVLRQAIDQLQGANPVEDSKGDDGPN